MRRGSCGATDRFLRARSGHGHSLFLHAASCFVICVDYGAGAAAITTQPASRTVAVGAPVTFSVRASGATPLGYQKPANPDAILEIALINGTYRGAGRRGDASNFDSVFRTTVEGVPTVSGTPATAARWIRGHADGDGDRRPADDSQRRGREPQQDLLRRDRTARSDRGGVCPRGRWSHRAPASPPASRSSSPVRQASSCCSCGRRARTGSRVPGSRCPPCPRIRVDRRPEILGHGRFRRGPHRRVGRVPAAVGLCEVYLPLSGGCIRPAAVSRATWSRST